jgi:outer membrane protein OmpA-like peptidoglycan-associated protein
MYRSSYLLALILTFIFAYAGSAQDFRVQAAAFGERMPASFFTSKGLETYIETTDQMGLYRYIAGSYKTREEADIVQKDLQEKGFPFALVIDIEEQRLLCGQGCPYFKNGVIFVKDDKTQSTVRNIYFDFGRYSLNPESKEELQDVFQQLKNNPKLTLKILGYTDGIGSATANVQLATNRSRAARNYLINKGIRADRMYIKVFGEADPAAPNAEDSGDDLPENRKWNRRVVLTILDESGEIKADEKKK